MYMILNIKNNEYKRFEKLGEEYYRVFTIISQEDKKPIISHCVQGTHKTCIMSFNNYHYLVLNIIILQKITLI